MDDLPLARRDVIARRLAQGQAVVAATLASEFNVSEDAIRRDLRALAADGLCRRVYGGALPLLAAPPPLAVRIDDDRDRKEALAQAATSLIKPGEFLFLDTGSTNLALIRVLPADHHLTVATNSVDIAAAALRRPDLRLILVGGAVDPVVGGCIDGTAVLAVMQMNIDRCFIGACALSPAFGVSTFDASDAAFKRALLASSRYRLALVTTDKLGTGAPHRVALVDEIDCLVVERDAPAHILDALAQAGASIRLAR